MLFQRFVQSSRGSRRKAKKKFKMFFSSFRNPRLFCTNYLKARQI